MLGADEQRILAWVYRVADVTEGKKQIPFICELDTGKWMVSSSTWVFYNKIPAIDSSCTVFMKVKDTVVVLMRSLAYF